MSRQIVLVLSLLIAVSTALKCNKCAIFPFGDLTEDQKTSLTSVLTTLKVPTCSDSTQDQTVECSDAQDQCHNVTVNSKLGGDKIHTGSLLQCGEKAKKDGLCVAYTALAGGLDFIIDDCEISSCEKDSCFALGNAGVSHQYSMYTLIVSAVAYFVVSL